MPKIYSLADKKRWLEQYENGKSEVSIAKEKKNNCDARTVKKGIEEAHRERDAQNARAELIKNALLKHQESLLEKLRGVLSSLTLPDKGWEPLSWYQTENSIFSKEVKPIVGIQSYESSDEGEHRKHGEDRLQLMLKQHLKKDKLWKYLALWDKAYAAHWSARIKLQHAIADLLRRETGYKLVDNHESTPPFLYSHNVGQLFFKMTVFNAFNKNAFNKDVKENWLKDIIADTAAGNVRYGAGSILAVAPGKEKECKKKLLAAYKKMQELPEIEEVVSSFEELEKAMSKPRDAIEEILLLELIPGRCDACQRLGL